MANFDTAYQLTSEHEGGYANVIGDAGGETYKGIARNYWPNWDGWSWVDITKHGLAGTSAQSINNVLSKLPEIEASVKRFYKKHFWDAAKLDSINPQNIANEIYDTGVNFGMSKAIKYLQEAINFTRKDVELTVDGIAGTKTIDAVNTHQNTALLYKVLNILQAEGYIEIIRKNTTQEKFFKGWLNRVVFA